MTRITYMFILLWACSSPGEKDGQSQGGPTVDQVVERWLEVTGIPSASYVIIREGEIQTVAAIGYANVKKGTTVDDETVYNVGSTFKTVVATAIMLLQEKGAIDIDEPVNSYLTHPIPSFDDTRPITARHLLSHLSGLPASIGMTRIWERDRGPSLDEIRSQLSPVSLPGEQYRYCNDGYVLLALLIEEVTGTSFETYIRKHLFEPLGIRTVGFLTPTAEMAEELALPYHMRFNTAYPTDQVHLDQFPAGDIFLTPRDMAKFILLHLNQGQAPTGTLLSPESIAAMHRPMVKVSDTFSYGLGVGLETIETKVYSFHQGSLPGYLAAYRLDMETRSGVFVSTNVSASPLQEEQLSVLLDGLMDYADGKGIRMVEVPTDESLPQDSISHQDRERYVGDYRIQESPVHLTIERARDGLYLRNPSGLRFRIEPFSQGNYFLTTENEDIRFHEENGQVAGLSLTSGESVLQAQKVN